MNFDLYRKIDFNTFLFAECQDISPEDRLDCGYPGITSTNCVNSGCCFDDSVSGVFWCFVRGATKI